MIRSRPKRAPVEGGTARNPCLRLLAAALAAAVAGCATVGPDFKPPPAPSATRYTSPGEMTAPNAGVGPEMQQTLALGGKVTVEWWTLFRSPDLDLLVKQAIAGSPTLESAKARLVQAREEVTAAAAALYPQVGFNAGFTREKESAATFGLAPSAFPLPPNFNLFQVGPTASYTPDLFGGTHRRIERQAALADFQRDQLHAAYLTLTGNTVAQAIQVAVMRAQMKALGDILDIDRQNLELVRKQRQVGTVPAGAQIGIATAQLYPAITLSAGISASSLNGGNLFNVGGLAWSIAAGLAQPVFDGGMRQAERRAALAAFKASAADYQQTVLQAFGQVADILQALTHDANLLAAEQHALDMASESVRLQRIIYARGGAGILELLDAQRRYQQALLGQVGAQAQRYQDTIQLLVAMGGGWWDAKLTLTDESGPAR